MSDLPIAPPVEDAPQTDTDEGGTTDRLGELLPYFGERPPHAQPDWLLVHAMDLDAQGVSRRADGSGVLRERSFDAAGTTGEVRLTFVPA